jgi:hypothetical protein
MRDVGAERLEPVRASPLDLAVAVRAEIPARPLQPEQALDLIPDCQADEDDQEDERDERDVEAELRCLGAAPALDPHAPLRPMEAIGVLDRR